MPYKNYEMAKSKARENYNKNRDARLKQKREYYSKNRDELRKKLREYAKSHITERKNYQQDRHLKIKRALFGVLGGKCSNPNCAVPNGCSDFRCLQIDHIHGGGLKHRKKTRTGSDSYYLLILKEIKAGSKDYQLLCANCNWIKRYENKEEKWQK